MKRTTFFAALTGAAISAIATTALISSTALAQKSEPAKPSGGAAAPSHDDMAAMMQKWMEFASPSEMHRHLDRFVGEWETTTRVWMSGPEGPPTETKGTATSTWTLDGRFVKEELNDSLMGQPRTGIGFMGYDNFRKCYVSCWMDSLGTALHTANGMRNPHTGVIDLYGLMDEFLTGEVGKTVRFSVRVLGQDRHVLEVYDLAAGPEYKVVEIEYRRKK